VEGLVGRQPPFHTPVFVLTHHPREPWSWREAPPSSSSPTASSPPNKQANQAAGGRDVLLGGGASVVQQDLAARVVDE
jgi:dihydrofolate reductase